mmetsp:Transcript_50697/g.136102  ORF Transcript_50697/g.136102 Transcript_50697/m.136102 type:complete len:792 (-) Transcript_50697:80-2455(-)
MGCASSTLAQDRAGDASTPGTRAKKDDEKLLDKYKLGKILGQGAFGVVYSCKMKFGGEEFAVKMIDQVETPVAEIKQEVEMLKRLTHPCVVKLHDVYYEKVFVCMVLEIYRGGDMIEGMQLHWKSKGMIKMPCIQNVSKMMFQGVDWLHQNNVIHRDLKGDNYLQDRKEVEHPDCRIYLSDFGTVVDLARGLKLRQKCGTKTYWGPEFYSLNYGLKVDVWALGVVIFGMVTGRFPFKGEEDVKTKAVKVPSRCGEDGQSFILGTLEREEGKRLSARQALEHPFLASIKSSAETQEPFDTDFKPEVREAGANPGIRERRQELVDRLENAANKKANEVETSFFEDPAKVLAGFQTHDARADRTVKFEWWTPAKIAEAKFIDESKAVTLKEDETQAAKQSEQGIKHMLESHGISTSKFGQGQAKNFTEFVTEVQDGQARLMLDASKHKNVVRVVDIVLLRIGHGTSANKRFLVKTAEKYPDGRMRADINQLVGTKKLPHENGMQTAERIVAERLNMGDCKIEFSFKRKECFEEDEESPSYPGVRTVYRKEIFEGLVTASESAIMQRIGIAGGDSSGSFNHEDAKQYTHYYGWMTDAQCTSKKVALRAPAEGSDVSALVSPPIGLDEEELQSFLQESKVDISKFGKDGVKTIQEFSNELVGGEAAVVRRADGSLIRVVDVLILKVVKQDGSVVVEVEETSGDGKKKETKRLPAVKRRADENPFTAAHRVLSKVLKFSENLVTIDPSNVMVIEEETASTSYGGLPTLYRRRIITAKLNEQGGTHLAGTVGRPLTNL